MSKLTMKDGTRIFYKDWGVGKPLFFHHGWPLSADDWDAQMMFFLERGYRVIAQFRPQPPYRPASIRTLALPVPFGVLNFISGAAISRLELAACVTSIGSAAHVRSHPNSAILQFRNQLFKLLCGCLEAATVAQRLIDFACRPEPVQKNSKFPGHGNNRPLLRILASRAHPLSPPFQVCIRPLPT